MFKNRLSQWTMALAFVCFGLCSTSVHATEANPKVSLKTNLGEIVLELNKEKAPITVANFLTYVEEGHYNGTIFHRVISNFMIQGGGFTTTLQKKPTRASIQNEAGNGLKNTIYTVAMARLPEPHSASAQFFINVKNNAFLDYPGQDGWGYAVFGKVIDGKDVVRRIKNTATNTYDQPYSMVIIESATILK